MARKAVRAAFAATAAVAGAALLVIAVVAVVLPPTELKAVRSDAEDAQARLEPVKRISIFDQWTAPNKPAQEDFKTSNPSYAYVKPYVTTGRKYDAHVNQLMGAQCNSKCQARPGYNPSLDVVASCMRFCQRLYDDNDPAVVTPQPKSRGWWRRKADSFVPGGRYVHWVANPFGGGAPAMNGEYIPDPYHTRPLGSGEGNAWISTVEGRAGAGKAEQIAAIANLPAEKAAVKTSLKVQAPAPDALDQDGPPLQMNADKAKPAALKVQHAEQLLMTDLVTTDAKGTHGLEAVDFGRHTALRDLDDYFDTLPTKDCNKPTCSYVDVKKQKTKTLVKKGHKFTTKDVERYERSVLGYHRRHEAAMTEEEMSKIGRESNKLVEKSVVGYHDLEKTANTKGARVESDAAFRSQRHSAAYDDATKAKGFVGYYENVFDESDHKASREEPDGLHGDDRRAALRRRGAARLKGAGELEAARAVLAHDTHEAQERLAQQEQRYKQLVSAKLQEEQAAVALAAHKINQLKADNEKLQSKDAALAKQALRERQARAAEAAEHQLKQQAADAAVTAAKGAEAAGAEATGSSKTVSATKASAPKTRAAAAKTGAPVPAGKRAGASGEGVLNPSGIKRSEGELESQVRALEEFEHKSAARDSKARRGVEAFERNAAATATAAGRKSGSRAEKARFEALWNAAEDDAVEPPESDLPTHWDAKRVNKQIANWAASADSEEGRGIF